jgi:hypothetical protein
MVVSTRPEDAMTAEHLVKLLQMTGAALAIPAAAAGTFAAYQSYFSTDMTCQKLRNDIVGILERNVAPDTKRSLLKKDVTEFDKFCGEGDPDARAIFQAAMSEHPTEPAHAAAAGPVPTGASSQRAQTAAIGVFGAPGSKDRYGWVALARRQSGSWEAHFSGLRDLRYLVAARRHGFVRQDHAAGLVRAASRRQRSEQAAEPPAVRRLRARGVDSRRQRSIVGRSRARLVLVSESVPT